MHQNRLNISSANLNVMLKAAFAASKGIVRDFGELEHLQVSRKGTGGFVTKTDMRAEKIIREQLQKARPDYSILMEESGLHQGADPEYRFIVDPLDGTTNFMHGFPHFCISIALEHSGNIVAALVYDPIKDDLFYAEKGRGAFNNEQRLRVSGRSKLDQALIGIGFPHKNYKGTVDFYPVLKTLEASTTSLRRSGSSILDLCYVASGRLDGYFSPDLEIWDMAAGSLIVGEAGGFVYDADGRKNYFEQKAIIAGNEPIGAALVKQIAA